MKHHSIRKKLHMLVAINKSHSSQVRSGVRVSIKRNSSSEEYNELDLGEGDELGGGSQNFI
jgi:hypothetical protein